MRYTKRIADIDHDTGEQRRGKNDELLFIGDFDSFDTEELRKALVAAGVESGIVATSEQITVTTDQEELADQVCRAHFEKDWEAWRADVKAIKEEEAKLGIPRWGRELIAKDPDHPLYAQVEVVESTVASLRSKL